MSPVLNWYYEKLEKEKKKKAKGKAMDKHLDNLEKSCKLAVGDVRREVERLKKQSPGAANQKLAAIMKRLMTKPMPASLARAASNFTSRANRFPVPGRFAPDPAPSRSRSLFLFRSFQNDILSLLSPMGSGAFARDMSTFFRPPGGTFFLGRYNPDLVVSLHHELKRNVILINDTEEVTIRLMRSIRRRLAGLI